MEHEIRVEDLIEHREFLRALARGLVGDAARADDVVQDAYVRALERPPRDTGALRTWLARIVHNLSLNTLRGETRRSLREESTARGPRVASHEAVLERLEISRLVIDAVQALPEPYRSTLYQHYYEGRSVRAIASDLGLPEETVKTRLRRAIARLRKALDIRSGGDRASWLAALAPLASAPPLGIEAGWGTELTRATKVASTSTGAAGPVSILGSILGAILTMKKLTLAVVTLLVALAGLHYFDAFGVAPVSDAALALSRSEPIAPASGLPVEDVTPRESSTPELLSAQRRTVLEGQLTGVEVSVAEPLGSLRVDVYWEAGGTAAIDVEVLVYPGGRVEDNVDVRRATTDASGHVAFAELPPGAVAIRSFRGGEGHAEIEAGGASSAELVIPRGLDVEGLVRSPSGEPVAGASVYIRQPGAGWTAGRLAATTDKLGRFVLRSLPKDRMIGARAHGFGPAIVVELETRRVAPGEPVRVELWLKGEGGSLEGQVVDPDDVPIAGAKVLLGSPSRHGTREDGSMALLSPPLFAVTDEEGRFAFNEVEAHFEEIYIQSEGFSVFHGMTDVSPGEVAHFRAVLRRGAVLMGSSEGSTAAWRTAHESPSRRSMDVSAGTLPFRVLSRERKRTGAST